MSEQILIRPATRGDIPLITDSWMKSFRRSDFARDIPGREYQYFHHKILEQVIPDGRVLVACNAEHTDQLLGWICFDTYDDVFIVHYVYVKQRYKGRGLARLLYDSARSRCPQQNRLCYTHRPPVFRAKNEDGRRWLDDKLREMGFVYQPYALFMSLGKDWENENQIPGPVLFDKSSRFDAGQAGGQ